MPDNLTKNYDLLFRNVRTGVKKICFSEQAAFNNYEARRQCCGLSLTALDLFLIKTKLLQLHPPSEFSKNIFMYNM